MIRPVRLFALAAAASLLAACSGNSNPPVDRSAFATFHSRPDLHPSKITIEKKTDDVSPGYIFFAPKKKVRQRGPLIVDNEGQTVWFHPLKLGVTDFRVQHYRGRPVLTWWQGSSHFGIGTGDYVIMDDTYRVIATVRAGNGLAGDEHEFQLTPQGTALIPIYKRVPGDLSAVGGPKKGQIWDSVLQEVDVASGRVVFEWHSLDHVAITESYWKLKKMKGRYPPYDYFHINSIDLEPNGNLLVSGRNTHALYEIERPSGRVLWRMGGKKSDFEMGPGTEMNWQHDARRLADGTISVFDNGAFPKIEDHSDGLIMRQDLAAKRVTLEHAYVSPEKLLSRHQGDMQVLPDGHVLIGWGSEPYITEFARNGDVVFHARFGKNQDSYRAYRFEWVGHPRDRPRLAIAGGNAYVSWNGATEVARWRLVDADDSSKRLAEEARTGFETKLSLPDSAKRVVAQALDDEDHVLGSSAAASATTAR